MMINPSNLNHPPFEEMHAAWRKHMTELLGDQDVRGVEIGSRIRMLANCYESALNQNADSTDLSGPRLAILILLLIEEKNGNTQGINPTHISKFQNVSKNTISSLLKGLEDQGMIERSLHPTDKRRFLIKITPGGREQVLNSAPGRMALMNELIAGLTTAEQDQLLGLLEKLFRSLMANEYGPHQEKNREFEQ